MTAFQTIGIVITAIAFISARVIADRGLKTLSTEEKGRVVEILTPIARWGGSIVLFVVFSGIALDKTQNFFQGCGVWIAMATFLLSFILTSTVSVLQFKKHNLPQPYVKSVVLSRALSIGAIVIFLFSVLFNF